MPDATTGTNDIAANTPNLDPMQIGSVIGNVPFGSLLGSVANAIAEAQANLDNNSLRIAEMFSGRMIMRDPETMLPIDMNGKKPTRTGADGVYYAGADGSVPFEPATIDTRVQFGRNVDGTANRLSMLELGFTPNFYQFVETLIEVKISVTLTKSLDGTTKNQGNISTTEDHSTETRSQGSYSYGGWWWSHHRGSYSSSTVHKDVKTVTTPVDATFSAKYNYAIEASSLVRTKLVPVPPPPILEQRVHQLMEIEKALFQQELAAAAPAPAPAPAP